jgi:hypothetical protein
MRQPRITLVLGPVLDNHRPRDSFYGSTTKLVSQSPWEPPGLTATRSPLSAQRSTCSSQLPAVSDLALIRHPKEAFRLEQLVAE